jgi:hypothetical protein
MVVVAPTLLGSGGAEVGATGGELHVGKWDAGVEDGDDERRPQHVRVGVVEAGLLAD